eukprot:6004331-Pleurochrysis_carterae.AAC.1
MAEAEPEEAQPESGMAESRYDDDGRLVMEEENIILPTEWIGASRKVLGINHYDAVLIGLD